MANDKKRVSDGALEGVSGGCFDPDYVEYGGKCINCASSSKKKGCGSTNTVKRYQVTKDIWWAKCRDCGNEWVVGDTEIK